MNIDFLKKDKNAFLNLLKIQLARLLHIDEADVMPSVLYYETTSSCNLKCPACPTGANTSDRVRTITDFDHFKKTVDLFGPYLFKISLYNWGEPLINKRLPEYVAYATRAGIFSEMSTNLSISKTYDFWEDLLASGVGSIKVGFDGATQKVLEKYRVGADLDTMVRNLEKLKKAQDNLKIDNRILLQFHPFRHNWHEVEMVKKLAIKFNFDFRVSKAVFSAQEEGIFPKSEFMDQKFYQNQTLSNPEFTFDSCTWLYGALVVNPGGSISPCCGTPNEKNDVGKIQIDNLIEEFQRGRWKKLRHHINQFEPELWRKELLDNYKQTYGMNIRSNHKGVACYNCTMASDVLRWVKFGNEVVDRILKSRCADDLGSLMLRLTPDNRVKLFLAHISCNLPTKNKEVLHKFWNDLPHLDSADNLTIGKLKRYFYNVTNQ